uniref:WD repeat-containing protein 82 n=1 Tax=Romanomermis culicivorax TaxID=13658 RepID=A0A915JU34_ROMCU
ATIFQGYLSIEGSPLVAVDPDGLIFVLGLFSELLKLYDFRTFDKRPFVTFKVPRQERDLEWTGIKFSPNGRQIMITTNKSCIYLIDSFTGKVLHTLTGHLSDKMRYIEACYSPDSAYVFSGSNDGKIFVWSAENGRLISALPSIHKCASKHLIFNPKQMVLASSCSDELYLWLPHDLEDE